MLSRTAVCSRSVTNIVARCYCQGSGKNQPTSSQSPPPSINANVPGLSSAVIHKASEPLGPGVDPNKAGPYKVPEYFCYDNMSYFEAEIEMLKYRCPQPSALKK